MSITWMDYLPFVSSELASIKYTNSKMARKRELIMKNKNIIKIKQNVLEIYVDVTNRSTLSRCMKAMQCTIVSRKI